MQKRRDNDIPRKRDRTLLHVNVANVKADGSVPIQIPVTSPPSSWKVGDVAGGNYVEFMQNGTIRLHGTARTWRDELGDLLQVQRNGAGITLNVAEATIDFDYNAAYHATPTLADMAYRNVQLNHERDLTATLYPHIHWFQAKNYSPNFLLGYRYQLNGAAKTTPWTLLPMNSLAFPYASGTLNQISYTAGIVVPVGAQLSDIMQVRIYRDAGNVSGLFAGACPYNTGGNASAPTTSFDIHYVKDSLGSDEELVK